jgi:hypothetical protein
MAAALSERNHGYFGLIFDPTGIYGAPVTDKSEAELRNEGSELIARLDKVHGKIVTLHCVCGLIKAFYFLVVRDADGQIGKHALEFGRLCARCRAEQQRDNDLQELSHSL